MTERPSVSVLIPAYQAERFIGEAIESALAQSCPPNEILVVDDGSTDETGARVRAFGARVRYERREHAGVGAARNALLESAKSDCFAFLDADDLWEPSKLERQLERLAEEPALELVFCNVENFLTPEADEELRRRFAGPLEARAAPVPSAILVRRELFVRIGAFDPDLRVGEMVDWLARARESGARTAMVPETLVRRRIHGSNTGFREAESRGDYARVLKRMLDRRRRPPT